MCWFSPRTESQRVLSNLLRGASGGSRKQYLEIACTNSRMARRRTVLLRLVRELSHTGTRSAVTRLSAAARWLRVPRLARSTFDLDSEKQLRRLLFSNVLFNDSFLIFFERSENGCWHAIAWHAAKSGVIGRRLRKAFDDPRRYHLDYEQASSGRVTQVLWHHKVSPK